jgi:hypothetical protein
VPDGSADGEPVAAGEAAADGDAAADGEATAVSDVAADGEALGDGDTSSSSQATVARAIRTAVMPTRSAGLIRHAGFPTNGSFAVIEATSCTVYAHAV